MHFCQTTRPITKFGTLTNANVFQVEYLLRQRQKTEKSSTLSGKCLYLL